MDETWARNLPSFLVESPLRAIGKEIREGIDSRDSFRPSSTHAISSFAYSSANWILRSVLIVVTRNLQRVRCSDLKLGSDWRFAFEFCKYAIAIQLKDSHLTLNTNLSISPETSLKQQLLILVLESRVISHFHRSFAKYISRRDDSLYIIQYLRSLALDSEGLSDDFATSMRLDLSFPAATAISTTSATGNSIIPFCLVPRDDHGFPRGGSRFVTCNRALTTLEGTSTFKVCGSAE